MRCSSKADVPVGNVSWPACRSGRGGEAQVAVERSSWSDCVLHNIREYEYNDFVQENVPNFAISIV